jgi:hypothetical protein
MHLTFMCVHPYLCFDVRYVYTTCMITFMRAYLPELLAGSDGDDG